MPASTAGYRVIGDDTKAPPTTATTTTAALVPATSPVLGGAIIDAGTGAVTSSPEDAAAAVPSPSSTESPSSSPSTAPGTQLKGAAATAQARLQAVARGAGAAMMGARDAVAEMLSEPLPAAPVISVEPLNPGMDLSFRERVRLVAQFCRPWSEFFDYRAIGAPPAGELKRRLAHNIEMFFYNYLVVAFLVLAALAVFHPLRAALMAVPVVAAVLLYVVFPQSYRLTDAVYIDTNLKHVIVFALSLLVLTAGHVLSLLGMFVMCFTPLLLLHALLREHEVTLPPPAV